jgi:toxin ParE1/3/4
VARYRLSKRADTDVFDIGDYTAQRFGIRQAERYHNGLTRAFQRLADSPAQARAADEIAPGLLRSNYESHVVFFRREDEDILIVRVLHQAMDPARHPMKDD